MIMAKKGNVRHLKSLNAPQFMDVHGKETAYVAKPGMGRHSFERSVPLSLIVKRLGLAGKTSEIERVIKEGLVNVNNKAIREPSYPVGLNDIIEVSKENKYCRIGINNRGQIEISEMKKPDYDKMLYKVTGKYKGKNETIMIKLHDGSVLKGSNDVGVNDSVVVNSKGAVTKVLKLGSGAKCMVIGGVHAGATGSIKGVTEGTKHLRHSATVLQSDGKEFETIVKNIMVME
jgi:small subunit ribosomal protein S4e